MLKWEGNKKMRKLATDSHRQTQTPAIHHALDKFSKDHLFVSVNSLCQSVAKIKKEAK
jgi:hypothetical protein